MGLLGEIDKNIGRLSEPYCQILGEMATHHTVAAESSDDDLKKINEQLVRQLDVALQTIDEITAEYTRAFSGNQTALELENSSKKMQQIFQSAERNIRQAMIHHGDSQ
jgi:predicted transcriptional regulator